MLASSRLIFPRRRQVVANLDGFLTTTEAAEMIGRSRAAMRQACERGSITGAVNKGGIWLMPRDSVIHYGKTAKRGRPHKK